AVGDDLDLAVRNEMHVPFEVAQAHVAQRDLLDEAGLARDLDHVAFAHLIVEQDEKAVEVVLDQALRAEADGDAGDARGSEDRRNGDAELAQHQRAGDDDDEHRGGIAEHARQGFDARHLVCARAARHVGAEDADQARGDRLQHARHRKDYEDAQRMDGCELRISIEPLEIEENFFQCSPSEASMLRTMATRRGPRSSSSCPFFTMNAGTAQLNDTISPSTVRRIGTPTPYTSRRSSPIEAQKPRARMSSRDLSIEGRNLRCASGSLTFIWLSTASRSGGVQAARNARPITDCEIGTEVPMSGSVVMPLPLRQHST